MILKHRTGRRRPSDTDLWVMTGALLLTACGGGGVNSPGGSAPPTAAPTPTPTPTPASTPTPPSRSAEYRASAAVVSAKAGAAYDRGITGRDVTIAVIDSGIDVANPEFAGRISPNSKAFPSRFARCGACAPEEIAYTLDDREGHGTRVATGIRQAAPLTGCRSP